MSEVTQVSLMNRQSGVVLIGGHAPLGKQRLEISVVPSIEQQASIGSFEDVFGRQRPSGGMAPLDSFPFQANQRYIEHRPQRWKSEDDTIALKESIQDLVQQVRQLRAEIISLQSTRTFVVTLTTLAPEPFQITHPIPVTVEGNGEDFTATFIEANISASGDTEADALSSFKDSLLSSYELFESMSPDKLGPLPTRQWSILKTVVKRAE